jgi:hypothetical protein
MPSTWGNTTPRLDGRRLDRDRNSALAFIGAAPSMTGIERALPREVGVRTRPEAACRAHALASPLRAADRTVDNREPRTPEVPTWPPSCREASLCGYRRKYVALTEQVQLVPLPEQVQLDIPAKIHPLESQLTLSCSAAAVAERQASCWSRPFLE